MFNKEEKLNLYTNKNNTEIALARLGLANSIDTLINNLEREKNRILKDKDYVPNSLGIIQATGNMIDIECAKLFELYNLQSMLKDINCSEE